MLDIYFQNLKTVDVLQMITCENTYRMNAYNTYQEHHI